MKVVIVGQQWLAAELLAMTIARGHTVLAFGTAGRCRFTGAAREAAVPVAETFEELFNAMRGGVDMLLTAHATKFVPSSVRSLARVAIGYHPSLLPRHRGNRAVQATVAAADAIAGGTVFHLTDGLDEGPIVSQAWCFVRPGITAADLWREGLGPMGLDLLGRAIADFEKSQELPSTNQNEAFATAC